MHPPRATGGPRGLADLERRYADGEITNREVAERDVAFYKDRRREDARRQLEQLELIDSLEETLAWITSRSLVPVVATVTHRFAADFMCDRYGFVAASGCEMEETVDGVFLGTVRRHFEAEDKVTFVADIASGLGLELKDVIAIGDSTSDIPLFRNSGFSIALNASSNARAAADIHVDTEDLRDVIPAIEQYFSGGAAD